MYSQIAANKFKTYLLLAIFLGIILGLGWVTSLYFANTAFIWIFGAIGVIYAVVSYYTSDKIALSFARARQIQKTDAPELFRIIENLAITDGLPMPRVYLSPDPSANAFASGRDPEHAVVCVNQGILELLNETELEGVLAHEMSHIKNYDIRVMAVVMVCVSIISTLSNFFLHFAMWGGDDEDRPSNPIFLIISIIASILAPIIATLVQLAVSRRREYLADASGALATRYPEGLASALQKIAGDTQPDPLANTATAHLYFASPFRGKNKLANLFSTHPPIADRIARLRDMEGKV